MRIRREIGGVRLDEQSLRRDFSCDRPQLLGALEGQDAGERDVEPELDTHLGKARTGGEAVQDGGERALPRLLAQDRDHVLVGVAGMDDERQPACARGRDVRAEDAPLHVPRAVVVEVVEPGLADADAPRMARQRGDVGCRNARLLGCMVRMRADREEQLPMRLGELSVALEACDMGRDRDHAADASRLRPREHFRQAIRELREVEMTVAVDEHERGTR
jgi:hypothetical protein